MLKKGIFFAEQKLKDRKDPELEQKFVMEQKVPDNNQKVLDT